MIRRWSPELITIPLALALGAAVASASGSGRFVLLVAATGAVGFGLLAVRPTLRTTGAVQQGNLMLDISFGLLVVGVGLITFNGLRVAPNVAYADVALAAAAVTALLAYGLSPMPVLVPRWLLIAAAGIFGAGSVAAAMSSDVVGNFIPAARFTIALLLTPIVVGALTNTRRRRGIVLFVWIAATAVNGLIGLTDELGLTSIGSGIFPANSSGRQNALTAHPNHLGLVCSLAFPVAIWAALAHRRTLPFGRAAAGLMLIPLTAGIMVSGSRASAIAGAAGALLGLTLMVRRGTALVGIVLVAAIVGAVSVSAAGDPTSTGSVIARLQSGNADTQQSDQGRFAAFQDAFDAFRENPLTGEGYALVRRAHDIYLQLLQGGGLIALVAFAFFVIGMLRMGTRLRSTPWLDVGERELAGALIAAMVVWLITGLAQPAIYDRYLYLPAGMLFGLAIAARTKQAASIPTQSG